MTNAQIEREIEILNAQFGNLTKGMTNETFVTTPEMINLINQIQSLIETLHPPKIKEFFNVGS